MILRSITPKIERLLTHQAAVAIIGPRQVGKTTIALEIAALRPASLYLDLEKKEDRDRLKEPALFLNQFTHSLVVLDEIHRVPELFSVLRSLIDEGRRAGTGLGRFLILGSASIDLLRQSSETLAGRISFLNMGPFSIAEVASIENSQTPLWIRGGFPGSFLAFDDDMSLQWREDFIRTYLEREIPQFAPRVSSAVLARLWTMLAHGHGTLLNASRLASSLLVSHTNVQSLIDLLSDLLLVRRLHPFHTNLGKRLVKSPKVYIRDSGLLHALLGLKTYTDILGHPVVGQSWEGFVIENLIAAAPQRTVPFFYRTAAGAEIDLLLEIPGHGLWAIEIKLSLAGRPEKGFHIACDDLKPTRRFLVNAGQDQYPLDANTLAISLPQLTSLLASLSL